VAPAPRGLGGTKDTSQGYSASLTHSKSQEVPFDFGGPSPELWAWVSKTYSQVKVSGVKVNEEGSRMSREPHP